MIIDNPHVFREVIEESKPYFTHMGAEEVVTRLKGEIDEYAARYGLLADRIWEEEYLRRPGVTSCGISSSREIRCR